MTYMEQMHIRNIRLLLTIILAISMIGFIVWLICFIFGICGWLWGVITIFVFFISIIFFPHYKAGGTIPMPKGSGSTQKKGTVGTKRIHAYSAHKRKNKNKNTIHTYLPPISLNLSDSVFSSIFAPAELKPKSHMQVQVYLHLYEETEKVSLMAFESDKNAERRDYIPLQCKLKKGDKVDVLLNIYGETLLMSDNKSVVWQGTFTKCSFDYFISKDIDMEELSCVALLSVNGVPVGEMRFITKIVEQPRRLNPEIIAHKYSKVFISYSHLDESKVKFLHEGLELGAVPHFFDRKYLKAGDVFPQVIQDYINSADLFILCWSENASKSEYVQKERIQALARAFPQVQPEREAKLRIYPMSIEPRAELPSDMRDNYHFGEL